MSDDNDGPKVIPFPGSEERAERKGEEFVPEEPEEYEVEFSLAEKRQLVLAMEVGETLTLHRGDIAALGGIIRRLDVEQLLGHPVTEEEFDFAMNHIQGLVKNMVVPVLGALLEQAYRLHTEIYTNTEEEN